MHMGLSMKGSWTTKFVYHVDHLTVHYTLKCNKCGKILQVQNTTDCHVNMAAGNGIQVQNCCTTVNSYILSHHFHGSWADAQSLSGVGQMLQIDVFHYTLMIFYMIQFLTANSLTFCYNIAIHSLSSQYMLAMFCNLLNFYFIFLARLRIRFFVLNLTFLLVIHIFYCLLS